MHAVNVGPYLDFLCGEGSTYKRSRKVATAAEQIVHFSVGVTADKALRDIHLIALVLLHYGSEHLLDVVRVRLGVFVRAHEVEGREQNHFHIFLKEIVGHHVGAYYLALSYDVLLLKACEEILCERSEIIKLRHEELSCALLHFVRGVEFLHVLHILLL